MNREQLEKLSFKEVSCSLCPGGTSTKYKASGYPFTIEKRKVKGEYGRPKELTYYHYNGRRFTTVETFLEAIKDYKKRTEKKERCSESSAK